MNGNDIRLPILGEENQIYQNISTVFFMQEDGWKRNLKQK